MKRWHKIAGIIIFGAIGMLLVFSMYEIQNTYICQDLICDDNWFLWEALPYFITLEILSIVLYLIALYLFICLWRKGGKR